jgi:hypothetical protein
LEKTNPTLLSLRAKCYADPELRRVMRETAEEMDLRHAAQAAAEAARLLGRAARLETFWCELGLPQLTRSGRARSRLLNSETVPDLRSLERFTRMERRRLKASRRVLKEMGIK